MSEYDEPVQDAVRRLVLAVEAPSKVESAVPMSMSPLDALRQVLEVIAGQSRMGTALSDPLTGIRAQSPEWRRGNWSAEAHGMVPWSGDPEYGASLSRSGDRLNLRADVGRDQWRGANANISGTVRWGR